MTVDQALALANALRLAADAALAAGKSTVDLVPVLEDADDQARAELQAAIDARK